MTRCRCEQGRISRPKVRPRDLPAQNLELVPQYKQLDVLQVQPAATPNERAKESPEREVEKGEDHAADPPSRRRAATRHEYWHPSAALSAFNDGMNALFMNADSRSRVNGFDGSAGSRGGSHPPRR
jgi:hypothetical protein